MSIWLLALTLSAGLSYYFNFVGGKAQPSHAGLAASGRTFFETVLIVLIVLVVFTAPNLGTISKAIDQENPRIMPHLQLVTTQLGVLIFLGMTYLSLGASFNGVGLADVVVGTGWVLFTGVVLGSFSTASSINRGPSKRVFLLPWLFLFTVPVAFVLFQIRTAYWWYVPNPLVGLSDALPGSPPFTSSSAPLAALREFPIEAIYEYSERDMYYFFGIWPSYVVIGLACLMVNLRRIHASQAQQITN